MTRFKSKYQITDTIHENLTTVVYRAVNLSNKKSVIVKMLKADARNDHNIAQFINERQILSTLKSYKTARLIDAIEATSSHVHVFEDIGGSSLFDLLQEGRFGLEESLEISLDVAQTICYLHQKHIIHADINPKNIIYNTKTKTMQIIDFGYSLYDNNYRFNNDINAGTSGNLLYMSPEQTGRTKQKIDQRTDFYSFGMTLYHLFCGKLPFDAKDRYELIHKQIALNPLALHEMDDSIPSVISKIVEKLIEKQPDRRYQSDDAIVYDLKECIRLLKHAGNIPDFEIATRDRPLFRFGEQLFGRQKETSILKHAAEKVLSGASVKILVSGNSGVGKTRLIEEFLSYMNTSGLRIYKGKFEQYQIASPYHTFKQIFSQFHLHLKSHGRKKEFKIHQNSIQVLCQVFPELCDIFPPSSVHQLCHLAEEIKNQLPYALEDFFRHAVTAESPVILFMDDLQWADPASAELIQKSILEVDNPHLHFVASYREREIEDEVCRLIKEIGQKKYSEFYSLHLLPLNEKEIHEMLKEFLREQNENTRKLASLIYKKTDGNPFYLKTFLRYLIDSDELSYEKGRWHYALEQIKSCSATINMVGIINEKFSLLKPVEQLYLQHLALLGNRFELERALDIMDSLHQPNHLLEDLERKGFIELLQRDCQFVHDQIHQFVFSSIEQGVKKQIHRDIGKYLQSAFAKKKHGDTISITHHLNKAYDAESFPSGLFRLNVDALDEMIVNNANAQALERLEWIDANLYRETLWEERRALTFRYHLLKGKILYLNALHKEAYEQTAGLMTKAKNTQERLSCFTLLKNICVTRGSGFKDLTDYGNELLKELGLPLPAREELSAVLERTDRKIKKHQLYRMPDEILRLPRLKNRQKQRLLPLLTEYWEAAFYLADIGLMQWAYLNIIDLSFRFGNSSESSFGYVLYGAQMISEKEYEKGYRFGEVSLKLNHAIGDRTMLPKVHNFFANFINPYIKPLSSNVALYQKSLQQSRMNGDIVFGTWANFLMHFSDYLSGNSLESLRENIIKEQAFILNSADAKMISIFEVLRGTLFSLQQSDAMELAKEENSVALWESENFYPGLAWYGILKAQSCFIEGEWKRAYRFLERYVHKSSNEVIMFPTIRLHLLRSLLLLNKRSPLCELQAEELKNDLFECDSYLKGAPETFRFWKLLLKAERTKSQKSHWDVAKVYDEALKEARKNKNSFEIAISGICAGRFWKRLSYTQMSHLYFNEAVVGLNQWGAYEAAKRLKEKYLTQTPALPAMMESSSNSSLMKSEPANFQSLLKSFQAISQVMDTNELISTLLKIILENATASRAVLMFKEEELFKSASIDFGSTEIEFFNTSLHEADFIPKHVLLHAVDMKKRIRLENPAESGMFQYDAYIREHRPASCLVLPASVEGVVQGVLYLENRDVSTPLSPDTLQTLQLLLTQSAIVFKNASLYESLKTNEKNLNRAQQISHIGSWQYNSSTDEIEWSAETFRIYELEPFEIAISNDWFIAHIHPEDVEIVLDAYEKAMSGQRYYDVMHRIVTENGNIRYVHQRAEVFWSGDVQKMSGTIQDITASKEAQEQISRLSQVVDQNPYITVITDRYGFIEYVNKQCLNMTGYFQHELLHKNINIFRSGIHSDAFYKGLWTTISREKRVWRGVLINKMKNGKERDCESTIFPIFNAQKEIVNFVTIQEDVTERTIKDKLFLMQTRQAQMGEMLSMIAHQWRQPLTIMSSLLSRERVNILLQKSNMDDIVESFDAMELQIQHLSRTITDFRDFFKPNKEAVQTKSTTILSKTLNLIEHSLINHKIILHQSHHNDREYETFENELVQVMLNLFKNAQDVFEERNTLQPELNIETDQDDTEVIIRIEDNAGGIDPVVLDTVFLPYVSTKSQTGTGLGLYMCKTVVENHCRGSICVENTDKGARFTIRIPLFSAETPASAEKSKQGQAGID